MCDNRKADLWQHSSQHRTSPTHLLLSDRKEERERESMALFKPQVCVFNMPIHTWPKRGLIQFNSIQCYCIALCTIYLTPKQLQRILLHNEQAKGDSGKEKPP